jgi:hypothetical protein
MQMTLVDEEQHRLMRLSRLKTEITEHDLSPLQTQGAMVRQKEQ